MYGSAPPAPSARNEWPSGTGTGRNHGGRSEEDEAVAARREWQRSSRPRYSGRWSVTTVRAILINPAYAGDLRPERRTDVRFHRIGGGRAVERPQAASRRLAVNVP